MRFDNKYMRGGYFNLASSDANVSTVHVLTYSFKCFVEQRNIGTLDKTIIMLNQGLLYQLVSRNDYHFFTAHSQAKNLPIDFSQLKWKYTVYNISDTNKSVNALQIFMAEAFI